MTVYNFKPVLRDSILITILVAVLGGVLANSISNALFSKKPNWEYVFSAILVVVVCVLARFCAAFYSALRALSETAMASEHSVAISKTEPPTRLALGEALIKARTELVFFGISAKRSVTDDLFKRALDHLQNPQVRIRFLLLDPGCSAFEDRARDEGEPVESWRSDQQTTITRLTAYKRARNFNIELRFFSFYPVWRAIIIDREEVFTSVFLPGKRGTEASQYRISRTDEELAFGLINSYHTAWHSARSIDL